MVWFYHNSSTTNTGKTLFWHISYFVLLRVLQRWCYSATDQCCYSLIKKNLRIYLEKNQKIIKNPSHTKCLKKVKTKLEKHATGTCI